MTNLKSYIEINRWYMTTKEMAEELGVPVIKVSGILSYNKWTAISEADRLRELIAGRPDWTIEEFIESTGRSVQDIYSYAKELGIKIRTRLKAEDAENQQASKFLDAKPGKTSFSDWQKKWLAGEVETYKEPVNRVKEAYTQSGSPYGIADGLRKIKTK